MDLLTIILACSLHFDDSLVRALIEKVSEANPLFVGDLVTLHTYDTASSVNDAMTTVDRIVSHGGRPAVGLMGIPISWAVRYGRTQADLFDGCTNIAIGTAALSAYGAECSHAKRATRSLRHLRRESLRACILTKMGIDLGVTGYPQGILPALAKLESTSPDRDTDSPSARSQVFPDKTNQSMLAETPDWSNSQLYFTPSAPPTLSPTDNAAVTNHVPPYPAKSPAGASARAPLPK